MAELGIRQRYREEVVPAMMNEFAYGNVMQVPRITKLVVNVGVGEALDNPKALDAVVNDLRIITGQQPTITRARKSIATYKLREGRAIGAKVTAARRQDVVLAGPDSQPRLAADSRFPRRFHAPFRWPRQLHDRFSGAVGLPGN